MERETERLGRWCPWQQTLTTVEGPMRRAWDITPFHRILGLSAQQAFGICWEKGCVMVREHSTGPVFLRDFSTPHLESYTVMVFMHLFIQLTFIQR